MISLGGIIPPLTTPFDDKEDLYAEKIGENIEYLLNFGLSGILLLGSNGEQVMLSEEEKEKVFAAGREAIPSGKLMIAGSGGQSTRETIRLTRLAGKHGADAVMVLNPSYYRGLMGDDALLSHYHAVADVSEIPVIIYNMPANTGMDLGADILVRIAEHPNIAGLKDSGGDIGKIADVNARTDNDFKVLAGGAGFLLPALTAGAVGGILALANIKPQICLDLMNLFSEGKLEDARLIQQSIIRLNKMITRQWGVPALKAAMDHVGLYGGCARKPLLPLVESRKAALIRELESIAGPAAHPAGYQKIPRQKAR